MNLTEINVSLFRMVNNLGKDMIFLNPAMKFIAEYLVIMLVMGIVFYWFSGPKNNRIMVICGSFTFLLAEIVGKLAGKLYSNNQPFAELENVNKLMGHEIDNSFPSDHTILFFAFCISFYLFKRKTGLLWVIAAFLVGFSRIWVGVHYPADVIAGAVISIIAALFVYRAVPKNRFIGNMLRIYEKGENLVLPTKSKEH
jgi:undecaprenyl-diphosphatase